MRTFATTTLGLATALATVANAHSVFTSLLVNDANQGDGTCVRMPKDGSTATDPIASITGNDMACGRDGEVAVKYSCPAPAGSKLTFEWRLWPDYSQPGSIDISHKGPCAVYVKQVADINSTQAAGPGWFKIWHEGYDSAAGKWCTEKLIDNNGLMSVQLPTGLPGGHYLVRPELLALHNADKGDPQFYTGCAQIFVAGAAGQLNVPEKNQCSIPGYVQPGEKSVSFSLYNKPMALPYPIPGPEPYVPTVAGGSSQIQAQALNPSQLVAAGAPPQNCQLKVANWCGVEVPSYSESKGCQASTKSCYNQLTTCYSSAPPTGSDGCKEWEQKCKDIEATCDSGSPVGPPSKGAKLPTADKPLPGAIPPVASSVPGTVANVAAPVAAVLPAAASAPSADQVSVAGSGSSDDNSSASQLSKPESQPSKPASQPSSPASQPSGSEDDQDGSDDQSAVPTAPAPVAPPASAPAGGSPHDTGKDDGPKVSADGKCGIVGGYQTCKGSSFGECCSKRGRCGSSRFHCGASSSGARGCQENYGICKGADGTHNGKDKGAAGEDAGIGSSFIQHKAGGSLLAAMRGGAH